MGIVGRGQGVGWNVLAYGAQGIPGLDDSAAIQQAVDLCAQQGGSEVVLPLLHTISYPINLHGRVTLKGLGRFTGLYGAPNFSGAALVLISQQDYCGVKDMQMGYYNLTMASNPSADGIQATSSRYLTIQDIDFVNLNGYCIEVLGSGSLSPNNSVGSMIDRIHAFNCNGGIHLFGVTGASFASQPFMSNLNLERIVGPLDAILCEDSQDVLVQNVNGAVGQNANTNSFLHIKGRTTVYASNFDCGVSPGPANAPTVLIEDSANGSPKDIQISNAIFQAGTNALSITGGASQLHFVNTKFSRATSHGITIAGTASIIEFLGCIFDVNNQSAAGNIYDINMQSSGEVRVTACTFADAIGSGVGQVQQHINCGAGTLYAIGNRFVAGGTANSFNGTPTFARDNPGYNPVGFLASQPSPSGSPYTTPVQAVDCNMLVTGGTVSAISLAGHATGLTSGWFNIPAGQTLVITYTVAPSLLTWGN